MRKLFNFCLVLGLCIGLTGCSGNSASDIQKKLENAGYTIELNKDVGTVIAEIELKHGEKDYLRLSIDKEIAKVSSIDYVVDLGTAYDYVSYDVNDKTNYGTSKTSYKNTCISYNIDKDTSPDVFKDMNTSCDETAKGYLKILKDERANVLEKIDVSLDELVTFGNSYFKDNN